MAKAATAHSSRPERLLAGREELARLANASAARHDFQADVSADPDWWRLPGGSLPAFWLRRLHQVGTWTGWLLPLHRPVLRQAGVTPLLAVRVDDFPRWDLSLEVFRAFDALMARYQIPYVLGVTPFLAVTPRSGAPLTPEELATLERLIRRGVTLAHHGFTHLGKPGAGKTIGELPEYSDREFEEWTTRADGLFDEHGLPRPNVMIPPFDGVSVGCFHSLARRYSVVTGGPASLTTLGPVAPGVRLGEAVYTPSYYPDMFATAMFPRLGKRLWERRTGPVTVLTLHWAWEARDRFARLEKLLAGLQGSVSPWDAVFQRLGRSSLTLS